MLAVLVAAAVAYNPPGVDDAFLVGRVNAYGDSPACLVRCPTEECWGLEVGDMLVDAIIIDAGNATGIDVTENAEREITFQPIRQITFNTTNPTAAKTAAQLFGKVPTCDTPLEHVAIGSVRINASSAAAGSTRARFELPVFLLLADTFGAIPLPPDDPEEFDIAVLATRIVNTTFETRPYMNPMPPVAGCDSQRYICDPGVCTMIDINYQNFYEPNTPILLERLNASGDISFHSRYDQNRLFGMSFCGPVFGTAIRATDDNKVSAPKVDEVYYPTDVKISFPPADRKDPFAGLRVTHGHSLEVLYPAWAPIGCNSTDADDVFCQLSPSDRYGGLPFREERITNNLPLYTAFGAKVGRVICPVDQADLSLGYDVYNFSDSFRDSLPLADICVLPGVDSDFFEHCCQRVKVNYVVTDIETDYEGSLLYVPQNHTDLSAPVPFENRTTSITFVVTERKSYARCPQHQSQSLLDVGLTMKDATNECAAQCSSENLNVMVVGADLTTYGIGGVKQLVCTCMSETDIESCTFGGGFQSFWETTTAAARDGAMPVLMRFKKLTSLYDNMHTVIGWSDTLLPCCPWWANATELPPVETAYAGAETCIQNVTEIVAYAVENPEWLASCRTERVKTHDQTDWSTMFDGHDVNAFYSNAAKAQITIGQEVTSTIMPVETRDDITLGSPCKYNEDSVISAKGDEQYSGVVAVSACASPAYRKLLIVNAYQGNDKNGAVRNPNDRVQVAVLMQPDDCLNGASKWLTCRRIKGQSETYTALTVWAIDPPRNRGLLASHVQPCNGIRIGFTPSVRPAYTGNDDWDTATIGRTANDYDSVAYVDKDVLKNGAIAQAATLMYGLEPNPDFLSHLSAVSNCDAQFYNVNPFDAHLLWLGENRANASVKHARADDVYCSAATLSAPTNNNQRTYAFGQAACDYAKDPSNTVNVKEAVGSVVTKRPSVPGLWDYDETVTVPADDKTESKLTCEDVSLADVVTTYTYDMYATNMFYCTPEKKQGTDECRMPRDPAAMYPSLIPPVLKRMDTTSGELVGENGKAKVLNDASGSSSMAARFSCRVTNEVGLMPEVIAKLDSTELRTSKCHDADHKNGVCTGIDNNGITKQPTVRRDPYAVFTGSALDDRRTSYRLIQKTKFTKKTTETEGFLDSLAATSSGEGSWSTYRYHATHKSCGTANALGNRPVWHKGCLLSVESSELPANVPEQDNTAIPSADTGVKNVKRNMYPTNFHVVRGGNRESLFAVTPSWYPRARKFTGNYDKDTDNPTGVQSTPFRYVLDSLEFFGAAPINISMMMVDADEGPNNGRFLRAPMPVKGAGAGPGFVPADYPRRPYIPSSDDTCVCDRDPVWACITEGPEYWRGKEFPQMRAECENQHVPLANGTSPYKPPTCAAELKKCGWSWRGGGTAIQGGVAGDVGLYIFGDRNGPIPVEERDPLGGPDADETFSAAFLELWAPSYNVLKKLQSDSTVTTKYTLPGPCVRSPFGKLHSHSMTADGIANTFFKHPGLTKDAVYEVGREALIGYCETFENGAKYQLCAGDRNDYDARRQFCTATPHVNDIVMGWAVTRRVSRCAVGDTSAVCIYFAYEQGVDTMQDVTVGVPSGLDVTIVVAPMAWTVVTEVQAGMFRYDIRQTGPKLHDFESGMFSDDPAFSRIPACGASGGEGKCRHQATDEQLVLVQDVALALNGKMEKDWVGYVKATLQGLFAAFDSTPFNTPKWDVQALGPGGQDCPAGQVLVPTASAQESSTTYAVCASQDSMMSTIVGRGHTLSLPNTTLTATGPIVMTATNNPNCNGLIIAAPGVTIDVPIEIDQRQCPGHEATMMGVVIVGPDARDVSIANVTVVAPSGRQPATIAALGYDSLYGTKAVVNVTGLEATVNDPPGFAYAFAHAVADEVPDIGVAGGPVTVLLQEAAAEHFSVSAEWNTTNVTAYTSVFGWGYESKLYHQATRAETVAAVGVAVAIAVGVVLAVLLGASLCVIRAEEKL
jgi:hypothetical protein